MIAVSGRSLFWINPKGEAPAVRSSPLAAHGSGSKTLISP